MNSFEDLIEQYYAIFIMQGEQEAMSWLDKELQTKNGRDAVKNFVIRSMEQAEHILNSGEDLSEYEEDYLLKKNKKDEGVH